MDNKYYYLFASGGSQPIDTQINHKPSNDYVSFGDGSAVSWDIYNRDPTTGTLVLKPVATVEKPTPVTPTAAQLAQQRRAVLDNLYNAKETVLALNYTKANMAENNDYASKIGNEFVSLQSIYSNYSAQITAGNDPLTIYGNDAFTINPNEALY